MAQPSDYIEPIDYAERLFKIERLGYKRRMIPFQCRIGDAHELRLAQREEEREINAQISKLLEDE